MDVDGYGLLIARSKNLVVSGVATHPGWRRSAAPGAALVSAVVQATIVGAGVAGLTSAAALLDAGWSVDIVAAQTHEATVSSVAAAIWTMTTTEPVELTRRWALTSRERFASMAEDPASGVVPLLQRELEAADPGPLWWEATPYVRRMDTAELPAGYAAGFEIDGFMIEPPIYLGWLRDRVVDHGATVRIATVARLTDLDGDVVVNCSGLGAADLAGDDSMFPIRGQVVAVPNPGIRDAVADESDVDAIAYVYPRSREVVLGGTRQPGRSDTEPEPATTRRILDDCRQLDPRLAGCEVHEVRVGLRPGRPEVRVERELLADGRPLIHNYGHGGAGFLLSWGCALDVVDLAAR